MLYKYFIDIVEGNFKVIMRLILALAAHYKPTSVKHTPTKRRNMVEMAQVLRV